MSFDGRAVEHVQTGDKELDAHAAQKEHRRP
jgi:hypothetical protein